MKFNSIWGELEVGTTEAVEPGSDQINTDGDGGDPGKNTSAEEGDAGGASDDGTQAEGSEEGSERTEEGQEGSVEGDAAGAAAELGFEPTEDDVSKAYEMLEVEGVLNLGEDDELEPTPKGLADAVAITIRKGIQEQLQQTPEEVKQLFTHMSKGGKFSDFVPQVKHTWAEMDRENADNKEDAVYEFYKNQGLNDEEIGEEIKDLRESGKFDRKADLAFKSLVTKDQERLEKLKADKKAKADAAAEKAAAEKATNEKMIDDLDEIAGIKLDKTKKESFKKYLFSPKARSGKTQAQENLFSEDRRLRILFLDFMDFNKDDIVKEVTTELTKKRSKRLSRYSDKGARTVNSSRSVRSANDKDAKKISFPSIFAGPDDE